MCLMKNDISWSGVAAVRGPSEKVHSRVSTTAELERDDDGDGSASAIPPLRPMASISQWHGVVAARVYKRKP